MGTYHPKLEQAVRQDERYPIEAYAFVRDAIVLGEQSARGDPDHFHARQLLERLVDLARREFGHLALMVFRAWNIHSPHDVGQIVANLMAVGLMVADPEDRQTDFEEPFDLAAALRAEQRIEWPRDTLEEE
ncbi:MAG: Minf_1886 family protein [Gemmataceae bacterium]